MGDKAPAKQKEGDGKKLTLGQNMLWNSFGSITYLACQWLITIFVVRLSDGYAAAGTLSLAMSVYNIFSPLAIYRMYTYQVSDTKHENTTGEYLAFRLITTGIALAGCVLYALATCPAEALPAIALYACYKIVTLLIDVMHGLDQLNRRMDYIGKSLILQGISSLAIFCAVFALSNNLELALAGMIASAVAIGIFYDLPRSSRFEKIRVGISRKKAFHLLGYCLPIVIAAIACAAAPAIPRQYLALIEGEAALGIYASVAAPVAIIQMGASYIYNPLLSTLSEAYQAHETRRLRNLLAKVLLGIAALGLICAVGFELLGAWLLTLIFGESIAPYTYLLLPVIACALVSAYVWFLNDLLVAFRQFKGSFIGNMVAAAVSIPATFFFVVNWDMNGVSFTGIASYGIGAVVMAFFIVAALRKNRRQAPDLPLDEPGSDNAL